MGCNNSKASEPSTAPLAVPVGTEPVVGAAAAEPEELGASSENLAFSTLLEAFRYCDRGGVGLITDHKRFAQTAAKLHGQPIDTYSKEQVEEVWAVLDQDGNGGVNFAEFVEWAEGVGIDTPLGLPGGDDLGPGGIAFPSTWRGPRDDPSWNRREKLTDSDLFLELQVLLDKSYKKIWTRDRKKAGSDNRVPDSFELVTVLHSENYVDWKGYYLKRHQVMHGCHKPDWRGAFTRHVPLTAQSEDLCSRHKLRSDCNEWLLFHGTDANSIEDICGGDFTMRLAGSATGTLYGRGTYLAESITKADEYAKPNADGLCCVLLCRVVGGIVLYNDEVTPDAEALQAAVLSGKYNCIIGDREKCRNTFKEYVIFDADQIFVEYALFYRRIFERASTGSTPRGTTPRGTPRGTTPRGTPRGTTPRGPPSARV
eukprot:gnl/TRDRNA2_/TRDRNA2_178047_c0_seq1.p1 gnl/TRDRNA2_/TRDRNA2_178047_c0~~gnl/TRDRNA2_/TRDRNA2_178047_c0_seq1.p1  ORF type:complete len:451 (-),score=56.87 gnl/TRDRNA2_/TRDRNA2_178047_c0_seq1:211-1488(-)